MLKRSNLADFVFLTIYSQNLTNLRLWLSFSDNFRIETLKYVIETTKYVVETTKYFIEIQTFGQKLVLYNK